MLSPLLGVFERSGSWEGAVAKPAGSMASARIETLLAAAGRSALVGALCVIVALPLGVGAAWRLSARAGGLWRAAWVVLPLALPASVAVSGWVQLLAPDAASSFTLPIPGLTSLFRLLLFGPIGAACVLAFGLWPIVALNTWPAFACARDESYDAACLNVSVSRAFFQVVLPRARGEIAAGAALVFVLAASDFPVTSLLLVKTLAVEAHDAVALGRNLEAAWLATPLAVLAAGASVWLGWAEPTTTPRRGPQKSTRSSRISSLFYYGGIALGFVLPMLLCIRGVASSGKPYSMAFHAGASSLTLSLRLAAAAALMACAFACVRILLWPQARGQAFNAAGVFLIAIPGAALGAAILGWQIKSATSTASHLAPAWMAFAFAARFIYVPLCLIEEGLANLDAELFESASLLGQSRFSQAYSIALPLMAGRVAAAGTLVFVLALGEVSVAAVLSPPGVVPATIWLFNQQHMGYDESVFGLSLLLGLAAASVVFVGALLAGWMAREVA